MTASNQNFTSYAGDDAEPIFTVTDGAGAAIDLSSVSDIEWIAYKDKSLAAALTKKKSISSGITFPNAGTDGKIQVNISRTDTAALDGWYFHSVLITDGSGNKTIVEVGRWAVLQPGPL
jgi:hypothetical protein